MKETNFTHNDLISNLPIDLIYKIVSSLPYSSAATTQLLSKPWSRLWDNVLVRHETIDDLSTAISTFIQHVDDCKPFIHPWKLFYKFGPKSFVLATVLGNFQLHLHFSKLTKKSTTFFHLSFKPSNNTQLLLNTPCSPLTNNNTSTFHVKILHLKSVSYSTTETIASLATTSFRFVESLCIEECKGLHSLNVASTELKKLTILKCFELSSLHLNTPKLECFYFKGSRPWILAKGLKYELKDVMLDFRRGARSKHLGCSPTLLLSSLINISIATICRWSYHEIKTSGQYLSCDKFKLYHLKELWWIDRQIDEQSIKMLLSFLSLTPSLEKLFITIDLKSYNFQRMSKCNSRTETRLVNLKIVKINGCNNEMEENMLVESLLGATTSQPLIISKLQNKIFEVDQGLLQLQHPHMKF
ncbi:F-box protein At2g39490 isoform X1 [Spinacia oleracea]|uniref:F-box protein At2g39490 isoform X1 n=1 Tax=Spinacia oleracea TaxID=3562 RepID=A0A9R0HU80_SPIOL|nr:F-box protein At2g39490 isoform X1 [Spinacia oleracea]